MANFKVPRPPAFYKWYHSKKWQYAKYKDASDQEREDMAYNDWMER